MKKRHTQFMLNAQSTLNLHMALALNVKGQVGFHHLHRKSHGCFGMKTTYLNSFRCVKVPVGLVHRTAFKKWQLESYFKFLFELKPGNTFGLNFKTKEKLISACRVQCSLVQLKSF